jgi:hypothetical protein
MLIASSRRKRTAGLMGMALLAAGVGQVATAAAASASLPRYHAQPARAMAVKGTTAGTTIAISTTKTEGRMSKGFIGLSYPSSGINSGRYAAVGNLPALLANLGPSVLRFGGNAVDYAPYTGITPSALTGLTGLAAKTGWKVLYSVNLGFFNAANVTTDVHNVATSLGSSLFGIACGNEPEDFPGRERPTSYTEQDYLTTDVPACYAAVRAGAPTAPFTGPNTFHTSWLLPYATAEKGKLAYLVEHFYPMTNCHTGQNSPLTLISTSTMARETWQISQMKAAASVAKVPFIVGETNSASCGGIAGIGDTYASALWAASWILTAAEHGAHAMYFNGSLGICGVYTPLCEIGPTTYTARPVYYGLLFAHLMGTGWTLQTTVPTKANLAAFAVRNSPGNVRVMVQNLTAAPAKVTLKVPGVKGKAGVLTLTAPSLTATTGVRIQGAVVTSAGTFKPGAASHVTCSAGLCHLTVPAYSAVIVTLPHL